MNPFAEAATTLVKKGWTRDPYRAEGESVGKICIGLAMPRTGSLFGGELVGVDLLRRYLFERYGNNDVVSVNDYYIQTEEEALKVLRECARRWETR